MGKTVCIAQNISDEN